MDTTKKEKTGFTELEYKYWRALRLIQNHVNEPEVVKSIVDKAIGAEEDVIPIEEPEYDGPSEDVKKMAADVQDKLNKAATDKKINMASGAKPTPTPRPLSNDDEWGDDYDKKHEGFEEQAAGLAEILKGLTDGPNDNRW